MIPAQMEVHLKQYVSNNENYLSIPINFLYDGVWIRNEMFKYSILSLPIH